MPQWVIRALRGLMVGLVVLVPVIAWPHWSEAQITTDGSLGPARTLSGPSVTIGSDLGRIRGANLFHSFGRFNVNTGQSVTFTGPTSIANILSRVTGGSPSTIDGLLRSTIPDANMFLLNPSGVLFGPNATLDIGGSFHVTTADYIRFPDGGMFHATLANSTVLSVAPPSAFGFLGANAAAITVEAGATLDVREGRTLSLVGGDLTIGGFVGAAGGRINLASARFAGEVRILGPTGQADLDTDAISALGTISLTPDAVATANGNSGGTVVIRGGRVVVDRAIVAASTTDLDGAPLAIDVNVRDEMRVDGGAVGASSFGAGNGGAVVIDAGRLTLTGGAQIISRAAGAGASGAIAVTAGESIAISARGRVYTEASTTGTGDAGSVTVAAPRVTLSDGDISSSTSSAGAAGDVLVSAGRLKMVGGGHVGTSTFSPGAAGAVTLRANESISISGESALGLRSGVFVDDRAGSGVGGPVSLSAPDVRLSDGGRIVTQGLSARRAGSIDLAVDRLTLTTGATIRSLSFGAGGTGDVSVSAAESIAVAGHPAHLLTGLTATAERGGGAAGQLSLSAPTISLSSEAVVSSETLGASPGGAIRIDAERLTLTGGASVRGGTFAAGNGGPVTVTATESIELSGKTPDGARSRISSAALGASGSGGRVTIAAPLVRLTDGAAIFADTSGSGAAGSVAVDASRIEMSGGSRIESNTFGAGAAGVVAVTATESISLRGRDDLFLPTGLFSTSSRNSTGAPGRITVTTPALSSAEGASISSAAFGMGDAGNITVTAARLRLTTEATITSNTAGGGRGGDVRLDVAALTLDGQASVTSSASGAGAAGSVTIAATERVALTGDTTGIFSQADSGTGAGGEIRITSPVVTLEGGALISADTFTAARGGNVTIDVDRLDITGASQLSTSTLASGRGGTLHVTARDSLSISGFTGAFQSGLLSLADGGSTGTAGDIVVRAGRVTLSDGGLITASTLGSGPAGIADVHARDISITGTPAIELTGIFSGSLFGTGRGGLVRVSAESIHLDDRGLIAASTLGRGDAGDIAITTGRLSVGEASVITSSSFGRGRAGAVTVTARDDVTLSGSGPQEISVFGRPFSVGASIDSSAFGAGDGGTVTVTAGGAVTASGESSGLFTIAAGSGRGGDIRLTAREIVLGPDSAVSAASVSVGQAGNIVIVADSFRSTSATVSTSAPGSDGGNIDFRVRDLFRLTDSRIVSAVGSGDGGGGNITIDPRFLILDHSEIRADAFGGPGGNVSLVADIFLNSGSVLSASSALGAPGVVNVQAQISDVSGTLESLPESVLQGAALLREACRVRLAEGPSSSLVLAGRGGLAPAPGGLLPSPLLEDAAPAAWLPAAPSFSPIVLAVSCR